MYGLIAIVSFVVIIFVSLFMMGAFEVSKEQDKNNDQITFEMEYTYRKDKESNEV